MPSPRGWIMIFLGLSCYSSSSRCFSSLSSEDGHVTQFGPITCHGKSGKLSGIFSPPLIKGKLFSTPFFPFFFPPLFLTLVNGIWIYGNDLAHVRWKVQRWTPTMLKKLEQKNGRNLSPRWCSWATESLPVTIFLWAFWANKPWSLVALLVKDPVTFS